MSSVQHPCKCGKSEIVKREKAHFGYITYIISIGVSERTSGHIELPPHTNNVNISSYTGQGPIRAYSIRGIGSERTEIRRVE